MTESSPSPRSPLSRPATVIVLDTTLRDGLQGLGSMSVDDRLALAQALEAAGVDIIEAGFAVVDPQGLSTLAAVAAGLERARVCALVRSQEADIEQAAEALRPAGPRGRLHLYLATAGRTLTPVAASRLVTEARTAVVQARARISDIAFSVQNAMELDAGFVVAVVEAVLDGGAATIGIPDTRGRSLPEDYAHAITALRQRIPGLERAVISVHCHDDHGMAVANALAGLEAGARQIEGTIGGLGPQGGNCPLEKIAAVIEHHSDRYALWALSPTSQALLGISQRVRGALAVKPGRVRTS